MARPSSQSVGGVGVCSSSGDLDRCGLFGSNAAVVSSAAGASKAGVVSSAAGASKAGLTVGDFD
jgi:hypothetical protein